MHSFPTILLSTLVFLSQDVHRATGFYLGTGISCKEKNRKENFQMCLSFSFHSYFFKARISSSLQTLLVDGSKREKKHPRRPRIPV